ncbi:aquaporin family protein [Nocardia huaxiensis]|uniref:Aquaporin family protein n=2 Tax=Nocardia huaxiensis TaxID=2755382 RepID=A0A7D6Z902_9NOCA|nr:aquaporin family protein [Nocardia huaxiensis]
MPSLPRRMAAEFLGTGALVAIVVGSGIAAQQLSSTDTGLQLLENSTATVFGLAVLILMFGPISGAHFNPAVSLADWWAGRSTRTGLPGIEVAAYISAQSVGAISGAILANLMFDLPAAQVSTHDRVTTGHLIGEVVATAGLIAIIFALARTARTTLAPIAVAAWIGAAYWFTSSTSFANPAVTVGRVFTDTFAGIAPASAPAFIAAQLLGAIIGFILITVFYPSPAAADDIVVQHAPAED